MKDKTLTEKLIDGAYLDGGITIPLKIENLPEVGYVVGNHNLYTGTIALEQSDIIKLNNVITDYVNKHYCDAVGSWVDGDTLYIDIVSIYNNVDIALRIARELGEIAIYSLTSKKSIATGLSSLLLK